MKTIIFQISFVIFLFLSNFSKAQIPFQFYESATMTQTPFVSPITSYDLNLNINSLNFANIMTGDIFVDVGSITPEVTQKFGHGDSACVDLFKFTRGINYTYTIDTICTYGIDWSELEIKDCTGSGCVLYEDIAFPLKFENTSLVHYIDQRVICNSRQQTSITLQNIDLESEGYIEFIVKIGSYDLDASSTTYFDSVVYSEYPITISINEGACPSAEGSNVSISEFNEDNVFINYQQDQDFIFVDLVDQSDHDINAKLINLEGKIINTLNTDQCEFTIPCSNIDKGIYILQLENEESNLMINKKIYVNK